jgi:hypothetical protein
MAPPSPLKPLSPQELRKFGYQIGGIFLVFGLIFAYSHFVRHKGPTAMAVCLALGTYLLVSASAAPASLAGFHRFWTKLSELLANYVGHYVGMAFFTLLYWILFAPVALIMKIVGFDPLGTRKHRKAATYWHNRSTPLSSDHYERQFSIEKKDHEQEIDSH